MESPSRYLIGIDLGTTNSSVAYIDTKEIDWVGPPVIRTFLIPQLIAEGELGSSPVLPSFLYIATDEEIEKRGLSLPWEKRYRR